MVALSSWIESEESAAADPFSRLGETATPSKNRVRDFFGRSPDRVGESPSQVVGRVGFLVVVEVRPRLAPSLARSPQPGDVRNYQVTSADVTFEGQTGEEFLEELAVPAAAISGLLVVGSAPVGPAMSKTAGEVIANGVGEGVKTAIGESSSAPGLGDAIEALPNIVKNRWQLREVRRMTSNLEIRVNATWPVYEKNKFLWFDGWSKRSGTFLFDAGHRAQAQPADFQRARAAARSNFLD